MISIYFNRFKSALNSLDKANSTMSLSLFPSAMSDADLNLNLEGGTRKVGDQEEEANRRIGVQTATVQVQPKSPLLCVKASLRKCICVCEGICV